MNPASAGGLVVQGTMSGRPPGTYSGEGTPILSFELDSSFRPGEGIEVVLTQALSSSDGVGLGQPYVYRLVVETGGGSGVFIDGQTIGAMANPIAAVAGDWDGDGDVDLAIADFGSNSIALLRNDGIGTFFGVKRGCRPSWRQRTGGRRFRRRWLSGSGGRRRWIRQRARLDQSGLTRLRVSFHSQLSFSSFS
jgi:hypothetical protein